MNLNENILRIKELMGSHDSKEKTIEEQTIFPFQHGKEFLNTVNDFFKNVKLIKNLYDEAKSYSNQIYSDNDRQSNLKNDAARHILASAYISSIIGANATNFLGWLNELAGAFKGLLQNGNFDSGWAMDEKNNQIGINIGSKIKDKGKIRSEVKKVVDSGNFYVENGKTLFNNLKHVN